MIFEAGLLGFLRTVFIIIAVIAIIRFIGRLILAKKAQQLFEQHKKSQSYSTSDKKRSKQEEGSVRIFKRNKTDKKNKIDFDQAGEYVDYEEVD